MSDAGTLGGWERMPFRSEVLAIHAALLRTGKVLFYAGSGNSATRSNDPAFGDTTQGIWTTVVWDPAGAPAAGNFFHPETTRDDAGKTIDFFCGGETFLADGTVLAAGGTITFNAPGPGLPGRRDVFGFDPDRQQWARLAPMAGGRWYPSLVMLGDGSVLASGGFAEVSHVVNQTLELYSGTSNSWQQLNTQAGFAPLPMYGHLFLLRDGQLFFSGGRMDDPSPVGPNLVDVTQDPVVLTPVPGLEQVANRDQSASVLLPPAQDQRVMIMGGGPGDDGDANNTVDIVDLKADNPQYQAAAPMHLARIHLNAVLLPDRTVLVVGGSGRREQRDQAALAAEIYDPATNTWTLGAVATITRLYHSVALLLPDARVVTASGNPPPFGNQVTWLPPTLNEELGLEIYSPPYLFRGPRPTIDAVVPEWRYGQTINVASAAAGNIRSASLVRNGVTTHSYDTSQRLVDLPIAQQAGGTVQVSVTDNPNLAPPGWYMLFLLDNNGVPSVASWVHLAAAPQPAQLSAYARAVLATPNLVSYWRLDEPSGTVVFDTAGSHHGSLVNAPQHGLAGPTPGSPSTGFNGANQYARLPIAVRGDFSIECWFNSRGGRGHGNTQWYQGSGLVDGEVPGMVDDFGTSIDADGQIWAGTGNPDFSIHSNPGFNDGNWHHVVFTRERASGTLSLYVDGASAATGRGGTQLLASPPMLRVGMLQSGVQPLAGSLAHVAIYSLPLSATTVHQHSNTRN